MIEQIVEQLVEELHEMQHHYNPSKKLIGLTIAERFKDKAVLEKSDLNTLVDLCKTLLEKNKEHEEEEKKLNKRIQVLIEKLRDNAVANAKYAQSIKSEPSITTKEDWKNRYW